MRGILSFFFAIILVLLNVCNNNGTNPGDDNQPEEVKLQVSQSSTIASITRIPDREIYHQGDTVVIIAIPVDGYACTGWQGDTVTNGDTLVLVLGHDMQVYADFVNLETKRKVYSILTDDINGSILLTPPGGIYDSGTALTATVLPDYGYRFTGWSGLLAGTDTTAVIPVTRSGAVIANFVQDPAAVWAVIRISPVPTNGAIQFNPPGVCNGNEYKFKPGIQVTAKAIPSAGYEIKSWSGRSVLLTTPEISFVTTTDSVILLSAIFGTAPMGTNWTKQESGTTSGLTSVTGGKGLIVVVGNNGTILTSTDGISWTKRSSGLNVCLNCVIWTGSKFVIVGDNGAILTSNDGISWAVKNESSDYHLESVVWNGKIMIATGGRMINSGLTDNTVVTSTDGEIWTKRSGGTGIWYTVAWSGYAFISGGYDFDFSTVSDYSHYSLYVSIDGKEWAFLGKGVSQYTSFNDIIFHNGKFIGVGGSRRTGDPFASLYYSINVENWNSMWSPTRNTLNSIAWSGTNYVAVGDSGTIITADTSLADWTACASGVNVDLYEVANTGVRMVAVGYGGTILTSNCLSVNPASDNRPLVGAWKMVRTITVNPDGSKETVENDSTNITIFTVTSDNRFCISAQFPSMDPQFVFGTWKMQGNNLSLAIFDETCESVLATIPMTCSISGSTLTNVISEVENGKTSSETQVYERY
jgi:hypothetical protein